MLGLAFAISCNRVMQRYGQVPVLHSLDQPFEADRYFSKRLGAPFKMLDKINGVNHLCVTSIRFDIL